MCRELQAGPAGNAGAGVARPVLGRGVHRPGRAGRPGDAAGVAT